MMMQQIIKPIYRILDKYSFSDDDDDDDKKKKKKFIFYK